MALLDVRALNCIEIKEKRFVCRFVLRVVAATGGTVAADVEVQVLLLFYPYPSGKEPGKSV